MTYPISIISSLANKSHKPTRGLRAYELVSLLDRVCLRPDVDSLQGATFNAFDINRMALALETQSDAVAPYKNAIAALMLLSADTRAAVLSAL